MLQWDDLRVFMAVHRSHSHAGAARQLRVAATTVGRRLRALERGVGARLFTRTPEGLAATAAARALVARAERMEAEVLEAERELGGADTRATGTVRLTCGDGFAAFVLCPALPAFLEAHPGLTLEIRAEPRALDLIRGEADVALRNFRPRERSLVARRLGLEHQALYAALGYLARRGAPRAAADLARHDLVLYDRDMDRLQAQAWLLGLAPGARVGVRAGNTVTLHQACAAGSGVAVLSNALARDQRLQRILPSLAPRPIELWAVTHGELKSAARVAVVMRWLEQLVRQGGFEA